MSECIEHRQVDGDQSERQIDEAGQVKCDDIEQPHKQRVDPEGGDRSEHVAVPEHVIDPQAKTVAGVLFILMQHVDWQLQIDEPEWYAGKSKYQRPKHAEKACRKQRGIRPLPLSNQPIEGSSGHLLFHSDCCSV